MDSVYQVSNGTGLELPTGSGRAEETGSTARSSWPTSGAGPAATNFRETLVSPRGGLFGRQVRA